MASASLLLLPLGVALVPSTAIRSLQKGRVDRVSRDANASALSSNGVVDKLYTWGAPAPNDSKFLPNAKSSDGCWEGLRIVNIRTGTSTGIWDVDVVNGITNAIGYWHVRQPTIKMDEFGNVHRYPCGNDASNWLEIPAVTVHHPGVYQARDKTMTQVSEEAELLTRMLVGSSYEPKAMAARTVRRDGWNLVGSALWDGKESHLVQDPSSLQCALTFQGSTAQRVLDWWDNLRAWSGTYCGLYDWVHSGFRDQLRATVENAEFQTNIRTKLPKCNGLIVTGHSLGGALAALYSACINFAPEGQSDYEFIKWSKQSPAQLTPIA